MAQTLLDTQDNFIDEDKVSLRKIILEAKQKGKSKQYINYTLIHIGCPNGRKHCWICCRGSFGTAMSKSKGRNKLKRQEKLYHEI